jgi:hypothetical protein
MVAKETSGKTPRVVSPASASWVDPYMPIARSWRRGRGVLYRDKKKLVGDYADPRNFGPPAKIDVSGLKCFSDLDELRATRYRLDRQLLAATPAPRCLVASTSPASTFWSRSRWHLPSLTVRA